MDLNSRPLAPFPYDLLPEVPTFSLTSQDFDADSPLPHKLLANGDNISPQLAWTGFPQETESFLLTCFDPDAPTPSGFWHWCVQDIPTEITNFDSGWGESDLLLPSTAFHSVNDAGTAAYYGPNPPENDRPHRYVFAVHALSVPTLELDDETSIAAVCFNALFHTIARATLTGTYQA
ncbi:PEBP family protein [Boudabousia tangfeifanii]|uniref:PEBP family protein n=1 Tax=Boudabousia tangfeifanii TaxID=1912795 RepID=A0A1D9MKT3_9ACTO|nr:YbhB/YbcL family Raf kinase inhibitor-like protein [Boudabousia tangfeifanii]AOZ72783.1 PEBP family protein [Boudabousia tangfeifanii]